MWVSLRGRLVNLDQVIAIEKTGTMPSLRMWTRDSGAQGFDFKTVDDRDLVFMSLEKMLTGDESFSIAFNLVKNELDAMRNEV